MPCSSRRSITWFQRFRSYRWTSCLRICKGIFYVFVERYRRQFHILDEQRWSKEEVWRGQEALQVHRPFSWATGFREIAVVDLRKFSRQSSSQASKASEEEKVHNENSRRRIFIADWTFDQQEQQGNSKNEVAGTKNSNDVYWKTMGRPKRLWQIKQEKQSTKGAGSRPQKVIVWRIIKWNQFVKLTNGVSDFKWLKFENDQAFEWQTRWWFEAVSGRSATNEDH